MTMQNYRKKVRQAAILRDGEPLYNGSLDHAAILTEAMFEHAKDKVCIFSGSLNAHVYADKDVLDKIPLFLSESDHKIQIILENPKSIDEKDHPFILQYKDHDDVEFRELPKEVSDKVTYHFTVMDDDSYRFEEDKNTPSAIAAFGDKVGGKNLSEVFHSLWNMSEKYTFN